MSGSNSWLLDKPLKDRFCRGKDEKRRLLGRKQYEQRQFISANISYPLYGMSWINTKYRLIAASAINCLTGASRALVLRDIGECHSASTFINEEIIE